MSVLGDNIYRARMALDWSQETAAQKLGVSVMTWSRWERAENEPSLDTLRRVAEALGTTLAALVAEPSDRS